MKWRKELNQQNSAMHGEERDCREGASPKLSSSPSRDFPYFGETTTVENATLGGVRSGKRRSIEGTVLFPGLNFFFSRFIGLNTQHPPPPPPQLYQSTVLTSIFVFLLCVWSRYRACLYWLRGRAHWKGQQKQMLVPLLVHSKTWISTSY